MVVKTVFKSHFKVKKNFSKSSKKKIFVKNMVVFLLFTKIFFKGCVVNFFIKINFFFKKVTPLRQNKGRINNLVTNLPLIFLNIDSIFSKINSNTLNRTKISTSFGCFFINTLN